MAFSQSSLVSRIRRILNDNPWIDSFTGTVTAAATTVPVADGTDYAEGDTIEFQDDGEQGWVRSVSGNNLTVFRGYNGTTGAAHDGSSTPIQLAKAPTYQYIQITEAVKRVLLDLWPYVYKKYTSISLTPSTTTDWYNADTTIEDISSAVQILADNRLFYYGLERSAYRIELHFDLPTSLVASGVGIWIPSLKHTTNAIQVNGIARITATTSSGNYSDFSEGVETDAITYLAVADLIASTDITRTTQQDTTMADQTVRPGVRTNLAEYWRQRGIAARRQWEVHLRRTYPRMKRWPMARPRTRF